MSKNVSQSLYPKVGTRQSYQQPYLCRFLNLKWTVKCTHTESSGLRVTCNSGSQQVVISGYTAVTAFLVSDGFF